MDKNVQLNQFGLIHSDIENIVINGVSVNVSTNIPYEEVLDAIQWTIDHVIYDRPFISAPIKAIIKTLAVVQFWSDIDLSFIDNVKSISELYEAYDIIVKNDIYRKVAGLINGEQLSFFFDNVDDTLTSIMAYRNSAQGIVDILSENSAETNAEIQQSLDFLGDDEKAEALTKIINAAATLS